jgi:hypothetical protein
MDKAPLFPDTPVDFGERVEGEACPQCGVIGHIMVRSFLWDGLRRLNWLCHACRHTWAEDERRSPDRLPAT